MKELLILVIMLAHGGAIENKTLTQENVWIEIINNDILYPEIVLKQTLLESGHYKSRICLSNNNITGMRHPRKRPTTSVGSRYGHAVYNSWQECIEDYKLWQVHYSDEIKNCRGESGYYSFLNKYYSVNQNYIYILQRVKTLLD